MKCPKCAFEQQDGPECIQCGIIIEKYLHKRAAEKTATPVPPPGSISHSPARRSTAKLLFRILLLVCIVVWGLSFFQRDRLPAPEDVLDELYSEPEQGKTTLEPFTATAGGVSYTITPLYDYRLFGLVVSCHNSAAWWDIIHRQWRDFLNTKDMCVIWGDNISSGAYRNISFSSGMLTCYAQSNNDTAWADFSMTCLANNHLLTEDADLNMLVMNARKGDQVYLEGYLVNYARADSDFRRNTSTTRNDVGNGACEVVYLEDFRILKEANTTWRFLFVAASWGTALCCAALLAFFFLEPLSAQ